MTNAWQSALKFAPNLTWLYQELPFLERFAAASAAGFDTVEFLFPYEAGVEAVKTRLDATGLRLALFNTPPGDTAAGEFGLLGVPARREVFRRDFELALAAAVRLGCPRLHVMAGKRAAELSREAQIECALDNLAWAAPQAAAAGVTLLVEALNPTDVPGYLLPTAAAGLALLAQADLPNVKLQFDVYHTQMTSGNLITTLTNALPQIGHIQIADVPGRCQPGCGEINYPAIFRALVRLNYQGVIGLEYRPTGATTASLDWLNALPPGPA